MTLFGWFAMILLGWEAAAILTGDRWPPTVTSTVRRLEGPAQAVVALVILVVPFLHLIEVIG